MAKAFVGDLAFLSNMYPCRMHLSVNGTAYTFTSAEAAFQAGKCVRDSDVALLAASKSGYDAKKLGRRVKMRPRWDDERVAWMKKVIRAKFNSSPLLMQKLVETAPMELVEENDWHDTFWGVSGGVGENRLGKILMEVRGQEIVKRQENMD